MRVLYVSDLKIDNYKKDEVYEVVKTTCFCGEDYYLTDNNIECGRYYKHDLFIVVRR